MKPLDTIIIDTSVVIHSIVNSLGSKKPDNKTLKGIVQAQLCYVQSLEWMGELKPQTYRIIWVKDVKQDLKYWRHEYLENPENTRGIPASKAKKGKCAARNEGDPVHYKAGRKLPDSYFNNAKRYAYETINDRGWSHLGKPGYEADDIAAAIVHINNQSPNPSQIWLVTVDADWSGMVGPSTHWFCSHGYYPRLRSDDMQALGHWAKKRMGVVIETPSEIWTSKVIKGDESDNLPPGCPLEVIDLFNPPAEHKLWEDRAFSSVIRHFLNQVITDPVDSENLSRATRYLRAIAQPPCVRPFDAERDLFKAS